MRFRSVRGMILLCLCLAGCSSHPMKPAGTALRIALLGDTKPESPFVGWNDDLAPLLARVKGENPDMAVHLGNIIYGGSSMSGVRDVDGKRQYSLFRRDISVLDTLLLTVAGDSDYLDGSTALYVAATGRDTDYSINYGTVHFIVVNNALCENRIPAPVSMAFLSRDLKENPDYPVVVVFMHRLPLDRRGEPVDPAAFSEFTKLLAGRPALAVVCGTDGQYQDVRKGDVRFIGLPFETYNPWQTQPGNYQYYMISLDGTGLAVAGRRVEKKEQR